MLEAQEQARMRKLAEMISIAAGLGLASCLLLANYAIDWGLALYERMRT